MPAQQKHWLSASLADAARPPTGPRQEAEGRPRRPALRPSLPANQTLSSRQPPARIGQVPHGEARARGQPAHPRTRPRARPDGECPLPAKCLLPNKQQIPRLVLTYPYLLLCARPAGLRSRVLRPSWTGASSFRGAECCLDRVGFFFLRSTPGFCPDFPPLKPSRVLPFKTWRVPLFPTSTCHLGTDSCTPPLRSFLPSKSQVSWSLVRCLYVYLLLRLIKVVAAGHRQSPERGKSAGHNTVSLTSLIIYVPKSTHILSLLQDAL